MGESPVPGWVPDDLPAGPGVYGFEDAGGDLLYVGKSVNLRRRVRSYFYGGGPESDRMAEMLALARGVRFRPAGSELEARLVEARRILERQPPYNRAIKSAGRGWYLEIDWAVPFPRPRVVSVPRRSAARYFGPYRRRAFPRRIQRLIQKIFRLRSCRGRLEPSADASPCLQYGMGLCTAPCIRAAGLDRYRRQVEEAVRTLESFDHGCRVRKRLVRERARASERWDFEEAADVQRRIEWLEELESRRYELERPTLDRSWLIVLPHHEPGRRLLLPVARGKVLRPRNADWQDGTRWREAVSDACYAVRVGELRRAGTALPPQELVPSLIALRWIEDGAPGGTVVSLDGVEEKEVATRLGERRESEASPPSR